MSQHHRRIKHTTYAPGIRAKLERMLPLPCVECGQPVLPGQTFHVAHIQAAMDDGRTTMSNTGAAHARCNLKSGGRMGAAVTNRRRRAAADVDDGIRRW